MDWRIKMTMTKIVMLETGTTTKVTTEYFGQETFSNEYLLATIMQELQANLKQLGLLEDTKLEMVRTK